VARAFADGVHFGTGLAVKDLELAARTAELPAVQAALEHFRRAARQAPADIADAVPVIRTAA
jgi:3-hydroxyisobutyrate dehydrogenase